VSNGIVDPIKCHLARGIAAIETSVTNSILDKVPCEIVPEAGLFIVSSRVVINEFCSVRRIRPLKARFSIEFWLSPLSSVYTALPNRAHQAFTGAAGRPIGIAVGTMLKIIVRQVSKAGFADLHGGNI
jgi:hypothetical protein